MRRMKINSEVSTEKAILTIFVIVIIIIVSMVLLFGTFGSVPYGHRGVVVEAGRITGEIKGEGFYTKAPFWQQIEKIDVRIQKEQVEASAASKDLQTVHSIIAVNYKLNSAKVNTLLQTIGKDYKVTIIDPAIQEVYKANTARHSAEELIKQREVVRGAILSDLKEKLSPFDIEVVEFNIVNFDFSKQFNDAIEAKQVAEQQSLMASRILDKIVIEKEQIIKAAEGKAQALKIEAEALRSNPQIAELRWIEKWDGHVPTYWGNASPFIGLNK